MPEKTESFKTRLPVAAFLFRRPEKTRELMESLEKVSPPRLYLFADGPRTEKAGEAELCAETRKVAEACIRWPCEVIRRYSDKNLGLKNSIESGLDFVFQREEFAAVLEDDCVPKPEFFLFCEHGDDHYASDERIGAVTGNCFLPAEIHLPHSYYYSKYPHCWGWATWRSRWNYYARETKKWVGYKNLFPESSSQEVRYWNRIFNRLEQYDAWSYLWIYHFWSCKYLCLYPEQNLVFNTGFGADSTHTKDPATRLFWARKSPLTLPLRRPKGVEPNPMLDQQVFRNVFLGMEGRRNFSQKILGRLRRFVSKATRGT